MDQEQYIKKRMQKALRIADELNFMIEHSLGINTKSTVEHVPVVDFREAHVESFQGQKLYKLMKDFLDISLAAKDTGEYPEEVINKYLDDMSEFSFNPKHDGDIFEFTIQDYLYKVEVVMDSVISMTLIIKGEWVQTRVIRNPNDFAALMRIMDNMKGVYEVNPYIDEKDFIVFYNKLVMIADTDMVGWRDVERKVFVPYSDQNDIYFSVYNAEQFMSDLFIEIEDIKSRVSSVKDLEERKSLEQIIAFILSVRDNSMEDDQLNMQSVLTNIDFRNLSQNKAFNSSLFQELLKKMCKKHNVINRLKELADELKTFSDLKSVDEQCREAEVYSYESVKQYLLDNNCEMFLENAVLMTPLDSINLVKYIELREDQFIAERADIFIEVTMRYVIPLSLEQHKRILSIISLDPMNYVRKYNPELAESLLAIPGFQIGEIDPQAINKAIKDFELSEKVVEKYKEEETVLFRKISEEVYNEMDELERQGKVEKPDFMDDDNVPEYFQIAMNKSIERLLESGLVEKMIAEAN
jgi:hypothetical protein